MSKKPGPNAEVPPTNAQDDAEQGKLTRGQKRAAEAKRKLIARRQRLLLILVAASLAVNAVVGYILYDSMVVDKQHERVAQAAQQEVDEAAKTIAQYLHTQEQSLRQWAGQPALIQAAEQNNPRQLNSISHQLMQNNSDLLALRVLTRGHLTLERDSVAPIRFAEIDLLRRSISRQKTLPEAAPLGGHWQLQIATPVPPAGEHEAAGSLLATYPGKVINQLLRAGDRRRTLGKLTLRQSYVSSRPYALMHIGAGNAAAAATRDISGSYLSVEFIPSQTLVEQSKELPGLWLMVVSLCVTLGLGLSLLLSRLLVQPKTAPTGEGLTLPQQFRDEKNPRDDNDTGAHMAPSTLYQNQDILDIEVVEEDADILGLDSAQERQAAPAKAVKSQRQIPDNIFRSYDIRGKVGDELAPELARDIGLAIGSEAQDQGESAVIVARDGRTHSPELCQNLIEGILASGCDVINIGVVPTPLMHFACIEFDSTSSGVMVTASHNSAEYNGFKIIINGETLADKSIKDLRARISTQKYTTGEGRQTEQSIVPEYIDRIFSDVALAGQISLVIDAGNAVAGQVAPALFEELGCDVIPLHCELDGSFPNHDPDPTVPANLQDLIAKVKDAGADLGIALDGDGDRLVVVTAKGKIIWPDQLLMLFAKDILSRNPGADVLFDVKCSKQLNQLVSGYGGRPIMWKTGHSHMKRKMLETGALVGGEYSGHIFIKERWYGFDDGLYAAARLLEIITLRDQAIDDVFDAFPMLPSTPEIRVAVNSGDKFALIEKLINEGDFQNGKTTTIDGLRVDFAKGWGLVRASNTANELTLRFEAETDNTLQKLQQLFKRELRKIDKTLQLDF